MSENSGTKTGREREKEIDKKYFLAPQAFTVTRFQQELVIFLKLTSSFGHNLSTTV